MFLQISQTILLIYKNYLLHSVLNLGFIGLRVVSRSEEDK